MFNVKNKVAIKTIREWLDNISYSTLNGHIMQFLDQTGQLYPDFTKFMGIIDRINPLYAFIFSILRFGQPTEYSYLDTFLPPKVTNALIETGLLQKNDNYFRMPDVGIISIGGKYFVTGLPEVYPTVKRNNQYKPIDQSVPLIMDEIASQPLGKDFLEFYADYGILASIAATKGFENIQIFPKHIDYIPFIKFNLALNQCKGEVITNLVEKEYDLIVNINLSVKEKIENRTKNISHEKKLIQFIPYFCRLKEKGQTIILLESFGTRSDITINEQLKEVRGFNIQSVVLSKIPFPVFASIGYMQSFWEKQLELYPNEYIDYSKNTIEFSESKSFVFIQLIKLSKQENKEPFVLYPFYNPKYSDPIYNYAALKV